MTVTNDFSSSVVDGAERSLPVAATVADPAPLGLAAFALTTFVLSAANAGWIPKGADAVMFGLAFGYGGLVQLLAGMWEFRRNNVFGATAFSSYGGFWIAFALLVTVYIGKIPPTAVPAALGMFLLAWGIFTAYMTVAASATSRPVFIVFALLTPTFFVLSIGAWTSSSGWTVIGGYLGLLTAFAAWYASAIGVIAQTKKT
ncbi:MAG: acetate uptake transporter [Candidatus Eremiobacteraeota bacterium]|nr:acetate uptake transporter [Candidatus Eremiobacteraeota bacterium]